jgi:hypothetical protein
MKIKGNVLVLEVGEAAKNFDQIELGDQGEKDDASW